MAGLPAGISNLFPSASMTVTGPSTNSGPLSRTRIVTSDMGQCFATDFYLLPTDRYSPMYMVRRAMVMPVVVVGMVVAVPVRRRRIVGGIDVFHDHGPGRRRSGNR